MKLLILSHPCVAPVNQQFFAEVEKQTGWNLNIIVPSSWKNEYGVMLTPQRWPGFTGPLISIPVWKSGNVPLHTYQSTFRALLGDIQPDVVYAHHEPYAIATAQLYLANQSGLKRPIGVYSAQNIAKRYPIPFRQVEQMVLSRSAFAFPVSGSVAEVLAGKGFRGISTVLPLGVDPVLYTPHSQSTMLAETLRRNPEEILIGYLGRITEEKGLRTLLFALREITDLSWRLVIVGSGSYEGELENIARSLNLSDRIRKIGFVPHSEAPRYLSAFDLLVLPSETRPNWKEQFGRVIVEALACGTPVVGSDSGEIPRLIAATGGGLVFAEAQPKALAQRLREMICDPVQRARLRDQGQAYVRAHFTNPQIAEQFIKTIELVARKPRAGPA